VGVDGARALLPLLLAGRGELAEAFTLAAAAATRRGPPPPPPPVTELLPARAGAGERDAPADVPRGAVPNVPAVGVRERPRPVLPTLAALPDAASRRDSARYPPGPGDLAALPADATDVLVAPSVRLCGPALLLPPAARPPPLAALAERTLDATLAGRLPTLLLAAVRSK
jgi:hypothetical protein